MDWHNDWLENLAKTKGKFLVVYYEELVRNPRLEIAKIGHFLKLSSLEEKTREFSKMAEQIGTYKKYFSEAQTALMKKDVNLRLDYNLKQNYD